MWTRFGTVIAAAVLGVAAATSAPVSGASAALAGEPYQASHGPASVSGTYEIELDTAQWEKRLNVGGTLVNGSTECYKVQLVIWLDLAPIFRDVVEQCGGGEVPFTATAGGSLVTTGFLIHVCRSAGDRDCGPTTTLG